MEELDNLMDNYGEALKKHSKEVGICGIIKGILIPGYTYKLHKETNEIRKRFNLPSENYWLSDSIGIEITKGIGYLVVIYGAVELVQKFS